MPFFKRQKLSSTPISSAQLHAIAEETGQRRAKEIVYTLQKYHAREFERLLGLVEQGDSSAARLALRGLGSIVEESYIEPVLQQLQAQVASARFTSQETLEEHPNALSILLRAGQRSAAIELYQKRTNVDWQTALNAIKKLEQDLGRQDAE